ncbi:MAG: HemK family protein methyltransferase, partial [bacterium]|nr:HemK family protein methyltransferase [bacterium]
MPNHRQAWEKNWLMTHGWTAAQIETLIANDEQTPVEYLTGWAQFLDLQVQVTKDTLIPRLETEKLVALAVDEIAKNKVANVWEVGTGSGAIAIALASELQKKHLATQIFASDISAAALQVASKNLRRLQLEKVVTLAQADLLDAEPKFFNQDGPWFLVANLPYLPEFRRQQMSVSVKNFEPEIALFAGADGLVLIKKLLNSVI